MSPADYAAAPWPEMAYRISRASAWSDQDGYVNHPFAVHYEVVTRSGREVGGWVLDHLPTGLALAFFPTRGEAQRAAVTIIRASGGTEPWEFMDPGSPEAEAARPFARKVIPDAHWWQGPSWREVPERWGGGRAHA